MMRIAGSLLAIVTVGCAAAVEPPTSRPTTLQPSPPEGFTVVEAPDGRFSIALPSGWTATFNPELEALSPSGSFVGAGLALLDGGDPTQYIAAVQHEFESELDVRSDQTDTVVGGMPGWRFEMHSSNVGYARSHLNVFVPDPVHSDVIWHIRLQNRGTDLDENFDAILESFRFGPPGPVPTRCVAHSPIDCRS